MLDVKKEWPVINRHQQEVAWDSLKRRVPAKVEGHVPPYKFVGMRHGDEYEVRRGLLARAFSTVHIPGSLGFSLIDVRKKPKEQYLGLDSQEIVALKEKGVEITDRVEVPLVAYLGDTGKTSYASLPHVANAKVLLIECTFFEPEHTHRAQHGKHLHAEDLGEVLEGMNNERIIIIHVTRRTNMGVARKMLRAALPSDVLQRVTFLMSRKYIEED